MNHAELVEKARVWLLKREHCELVVTEISMTGVEEPDALGWRHGFSTLIECKVSRSDFLADKKKPYRHFPEEAVGQHRYYLTPKGLLSSEEVGEWGILELHGTRVYEVKPSESFQSNKEAEIRFVINVVQRSEGIHNGMIGIACRYYTGFPGVTSKNRATATILSDREEAGDGFVQVLCPACRGTKTVRDHQCGRCAGMGKVWHKPKEVKP